MRPLTATIVLSLAVLSARFADGEDWNFAVGVPEGWRVAKGSRIEDGRLVANDPRDRLLPAGCVGARQYVFPEAFRMEAVFVVPGSFDAANHQGLVWDDMHVNYLPKRNNRGLQLGFDRKGNRWTPVAWLGFSNATETVRGPAKILKAGDRVRLSFTYDGNRCASWDFHGVKGRSYFKTGGRIAPGVYLPCIGDRGTSNHQAFEGLLETFSVVRLPRDPCYLTVAGRSAFVRGETDAKIDIEFGNRSGRSLKGLSVLSEQLDSKGGCVRTERLALPDVAENAVVGFSLPVETRLRPGQIGFRMSVKDSNGSTVVACNLEAMIGPMFADRMPALMWGFGEDVSALADFGFTHGLGYWLGFQRPCGPDADRLEPVRKLDAALVAGVRLAKSIPPLYPEEGDEKSYWRRTREGTPSLRKDGKPTHEVSNPKMVDYARRCAADNIATFGDHPAFGGILPSSERRDETFPSFNTEALRYRRMTGRDVPQEVRGKVFGLKEAERRFPDGVVPSNDPILTYYRWFWHGGDGWPGYTGAIAEEYRKATGRYASDDMRQVKRPFFSFWDPAVRCPPLWGSGGDVDCISQWSYAVPEPMNVAGPLEEMFAMAAGRSGQQVMMMTQLICYRSQIAPSNTVVAPEPEWVRRRPRAGFPTIPPDSLQEATWSMLAKPVKGIMYHGWGTVFETGEEKGYCFTNPETPVRLRELLKGLVAPLGPSLKRIGRTDSPVAILESATTCLMGGPASWGWTAPAITFFQRARLDPRVVYEETILRDGLGSVKVLYAPQCRFLTPDVIERIRIFQSRGGILVGDEQTLKALRPDILVPIVSFKAPPESDHSADVDAMEVGTVGDVGRRRETMRAKATMVRQAEDVRKALSDHGYGPPVDSSSAEIVTYARQWRNTAYVFAINDRRTFGDYVGQWGRTMEKGLPFEGEVLRSDPKDRIGAVYELSRGGRVAFSRRNGNVVVPLRYETNDGRLLVFLREPIANVKVRASAEVEPGGEIKVGFGVFGPSGKGIAAALPVEVRVRDSAGRELDGAGWMCAENGLCVAHVRTNLDDSPGFYSVWCRDRASGLEASTSVVRKEIK